MKGKWTGLYHDGISKRLMDKWFELKVSRNNTAQMWRWVNARMGETWKGYKSSCLLRDEQTGIKHDHSKGIPIK